MAAKTKAVIFKLPEGDYNTNFIRALAMAAHLKLVQPSELTFWFDSGKTSDYITTMLFNRVVENRGKR